MPFPPTFISAFALTLILSAIAVILRAMLRPRYPGPLSTRLTSWILRWHDLRNTRDAFIQSLHSRYGALVQIAPGQISVNSADGIRDIFAVTRRLDRPGPLALLNLYHSENLVSTESGELHQERRKPLRGLYTARVVEGEEMQGVMKGLLRNLVEYVDGMDGVDGEKGEGGKVLDITKLSSLFAADLMSYVVYGEENRLDVLRDGKLRGEFEKDLKWQDERLLKLFSLVLLWYPNFALWLQRKGLAPKPTPSDVPSDLVMDKKGREVLKRVMSLKDGTPSDRVESLMERVVSEFKTNGSSTAIPDTDYILSETLDHFWAGVTTTSDALSAAFYQLSHPDNISRQTQLRNELKAAGIVADSEVSLSKVKTLDYLESVVKETLRHSMPIPSTLSRKVSAEEGMQILGHWIPQGMEIGAQAYSLHRNLKAFSDPESWRPERWGNEKDPEKLTLMRRHMFAFSAGPRMCIGMNIALTEIKLILAQVYSVYETCLPSEELDEKGKVKVEREKKKKEGWPAKIPTQIMFRRLDGLQVK